MMDATHDIGDFSHPSNMEDDILRYLMEDTPAESSTGDNSPLSVFEDSTPDDSPSHWSQDILTPPEVPQTSELSLDLNSEELLLYGSNIDAFPLTASLDGVLKEIPIIPSPVQHIPLVPIVQPPIQALPIVQPPPHVSVPIVEPPLLRKNRASTKKRARSDMPNVPSPQEHVSLPRDTLLQITSQSMEKYVETLQTTRQLSHDDQKELKRQKRLIKNRESAQLSRERKRSYIDQLEARIAELASENNQLKTDNGSLRQALTRFQPDTIKSEPYMQDLSLLGKTDSLTQQHLTKMGGLITVGGSRSAATKAGVCLLIVLFSFGLFMSANKPSPISQSMSLTKSGPLSVKDISFGTPSSIAPVEVGMRRSLLEAFPEVKEEENDTDSVYERSSKIPKIFPDTTPQESSKQTRQVVTLNTNTPSPRPTTPNTPHTQIHPTAAPNRGLQRKIEINQAGIFKVSYSPEPATFVDEEEESNNSTYMIFLDPRPDLDDSDVENSSAPVSSTHETQLEITTPRVAKKDDTSLPPMIINLVIPDSIANGSNPLLLPEGLNPSDSLMEITCQVVDISITTRN